MFREFWRRGARSRIVLFEVFAKCSLTLSDDDTFFFIVVFAGWTDPLGTQAVAVATSLGPTHKVPRLTPGREWRASRAIACEGEVVVIVATAIGWVPRGSVQLANTTIPFVLHLF